MTPHRIQRKRTKGWKMPANTGYVGRPSKWGNCFVFGQNYKIGMINTTMNGVVLEQFGRGGLKMADYTSTPTAMTAPWDGLMSPTLAMWKLDTNGVFATKYGTNAGGRAVNTGTTSDTIAANIASTYESANSVTITLTFANTSTSQSPSALTKGR